MKLFGPQDFNKNVFELKKEVHLILAEYEVSTTLRSQPGSYLTIILRNRDIVSFLELP